MSQQPEETVGLDLFDETASAAGSFPHSMLGYERQAVDAYIRDIERQLSSAKRKVRSLQKQFATATAETDVSKVGAHARDMLRAAEADAAEMRNRARLDADRIVAEATEQAELLSHSTETAVTGHRVGSLDELNRLRDELKQQTDAELAAARDEAQVLRDAAENHRRLVLADSERHATALREQAGIEADQVRQAAQREAAEVRAQVAHEHAAALDALQQHRAEVTALVADLAEKARLQSEQFGEAVDNDTALMNDRRLKSIAHADAIVADATDRAKAIVAEARAAAAKREREAGLAEEARIADLNEQISVLSQRASSLRQSLQSLSVMASEFAGDDAGQDDVKAAAQAAAAMADVAGDPVGQDAPTAQQPAVGDFDDTVVEAPLPVDDTDEDATRVQPAASGGGKRRQPMTAQPDEAGGVPDPAKPQEAQDVAAARPAPASAGRPRGWLHRLRRVTQPTPADFDPEVTHAGPRHEVTLGRRSPFAIGFFVTLGALTAAGLVFGLYRIASVVVLVLLALYLALGLNPLVDGLAKRGLRRGFAVLLVAMAGLGILALAIWAILPVATEQINRLLLNAPALLDELRDNPQIADLDARYGVIERVSTFLTSGELLTTLFGGLWGAGQVVVNIVLSAIVTIVLVIYLLAAMPTFKDALFELAPASRRPRVRYLANEMFSRIGGYVSGLFIVITCSTTVAYLFLNIVGLGQYALALAMVVALCAIIPLIGSTLSMVIVSIVAFTFSPTQGFITLAWFLTYQQIDNYFIQPRVFQRSVNVPGPLVILAALAGGVLYGLLGALLAIPSVAAAMLLYREVLVPALNRR